MQSAARTPFGAMGVATVVASGLVMLVLAVINVRPRLSLKPGVAALLGAHGSGDEPTVSEGRLAQFQFEPAVRTMFAAWGATTKAKTARLVRTDRRR